MAEFRSYQSYQTFSRSVKRKARYVFEKDVSDFLQTVLDTSHSRRKKLASGKPLWRAQLGHEVKKVYIDAGNLRAPCPYPPKRMKPLPHSAQEGRVNPKGIPCLYLATDKETAMAEVRPWVGSYISVGLFETRKQLLLIDCSVEDIRGFEFWSEEPDACEREKAVWAAIGRSFSRPVNPADPMAEYVPTQVLSELFRMNEFDGVIYKSLLGKGRNLALFNLNDANLIKRFLYEVKSFSFTFEKWPDL